MSITVAARPGDFDGNAVVNLSDFFLLAEAFGYSRSDADYDEAYDLDASGTVGYDDLFLFFELYGTRYRTAKALPPDGRLVEVRLRAETADSEQFRVILEVPDVEARAYGFVLTYDTEALRLIDGATDGTIVIEPTPGTVVLAGLPGREAVPDAGLAAVEFAALPGVSAGTVRLRQAQGTEEDGGRWQATGSAAVRLAPAAFELLPNTPNPFNPSTQIRYQLPQATPVWLTLFDMLGQPVAILANGYTQSPGLHQLRWDGRDDAGQPVASGVYFSVLRTPDAQRVGKLLLLR